MSRARFWKKVFWIDRSTEDLRDAAASQQMNSASWGLLFFSILQFFAPIIQEGIARPGLSFRTRLFFLIATVLCIIPARAITLWLMNRRHKNLDAALSIGSSVIQFIFVLAGIVGLFFATFSHNLNFIAGDLGLFAVWSGFFGAKYQADTRRLAKIDFIFAAACFSIFVQTRSGSSVFCAIFCALVSGFLFGRVSRGITKTALSS